MAVVLCTQKSKMLHFLLNFLSRFCNNNIFFNRRHFDKLVMKNSIMRLSQTAYEIASSLLRSHQLLDLLSLSLPQ